MALDLPAVSDARALVARLGDAVGFYKVGMALFFDREFGALVDELVATGKQVFLDYKMYDIPETVRRGVAAVAAQGAHGSSPSMATPRSSRRPWTAHGVQTCLCSRSPC